MKRKLLSLIIIITFIAPLFLSICKVNAYTGEIDPEDYISLPIFIIIHNKVGKGTISLSSSASDYNISYQKVDISKEDFDSISDKLNEVNSYIESSNATILEKRENVNSLQTEYQNLLADETATEEQRETARTNYETANAEYTEFYQNANTQIETLRNEYYALIPNYTSSWNSTTNTSDNVELDFSDYTGTAYFVLWAKIDNGTNTYYDFRPYSSEINDETPTDGNETPTDGDENPTEGNWTDFSKAKFESKKDGKQGASIEISGVEKNDSSYYTLIITSNSSKPDISGEASAEQLSLSYDKDTKTFKTYQSYDVAKYVELNQDLYANIIESNRINKKCSIIWK